MNVPAPADLLAALRTRWQATLQFIRHQLPLRGLRGWMRPQRRQRPSAARTTAPLPAPAPLQHCASVVIPALNEAARIASVVRHALADTATAEVIVVDDSSIDDTARLAREAGARVVTSRMLGKGASMQDGVALATRDIVVFLDGDLSGLREGLVGALAKPLAEGVADFVKARFGRSGGRVTELTAKPMLKVFFPELAQLTQPLGGLIAARKGLLQQLEFEPGYGVDVGLLIDAHGHGARITEVDIGTLEHDSQPLRDLATMAGEVTHVIYERARRAGRLHIGQIDAMVQAQRDATASIDWVLSRRGNRRRLLLLDIDTLTLEAFAPALARTSGQHDAMCEALARAQGPRRDGALVDAGRLLRFVHRRQFERVAMELPLRRGVVAFVNRMRRAGFMVGVLGEIDLTAAETLRRRVFADFALAHLLHFDGEVCSGELRLNPAFEPRPGHSSALHDKRNALERLRGSGPWQVFDEVWAIGDDVDDLPLLQAADRGFVIEPKTAVMRQQPRLRVLGDFADLGLDAMRPEAAPH